MDHHFAKCPASVPLPILLARHPTTMIFVRAFQNLRRNDIVFSLCDFSETVSRIAGSRSATGRPAWENHQFAFWIRPRHIFDVHQQQ